MAEEKLEIIAMLRSGRSIEDIVKRFPHLNERSLRAFKAHITMGTYDEDSGDTEEIGTDKEFLIGMLREGVPEDIILQKYRIKPSSLHAYKAHLTRGTYDRGRNERAHQGE